MVSTITAVGVTSSIGYDQARIDGPRLGPQRFTTVNPCPVSRVIGGAIQPIGAAIDSNRVSERRNVNKFKISKWIRASERSTGRPREDMQAASQHVRQRNNRYWFRQR